jgi:hypothetical protein
VVKMICKGDGRRFSTSVAGQDWQAAKAPPHFARKRRKVT